MNIDKLNDWEESCCVSIETGRPQWFKMWVEKYATSLDIENMDKDLTPEQKKALFEDVGRAFINALFYFTSHVKNEEEYSMYRPKTRDGRVLWNALKRDIDQSYRDYEKRVEDGKKGGRPPRNP